MDETVVGKFRGEKTGALYTVMCVRRPGKSFTPISGVREPTKGARSYHAISDGRRFEVNKNGERYSTFDEDLVPVE